MRSIAMVTVFSFVSQANAKTMAANQKADLQASLDKLVDKVVSKLLDWACNVQHLRWSDLDNTMVVTRRFTELIR